MDDTHKIYEQIEAYLSNQMEGNERQLFEAKMAQDSSLQDEVESFRIAQQAILATGRASIKNTVNDALEKRKHSPQVKTKVLNIRRLMSVAAAVLFLAAAVYFISNQNKNQTPAQIFATHYELPSAPAVRSSEGTQFEKWAVAVSAFSEKNYEKYIKEITPLLEDDSFGFRNVGYLFLGLSQLEMEQNSDALAAFQKVSRASSFGQDASWYEAMTYLKINEIEKAKLTFEKITNENHVRDSLAQEILKKLN